MGLLDSRPRPTLAGLGVGLWLALAGLWLPPRLATAGDFPPLPAATPAPTAAPHPQGRSLRIHLREDVVTLDWNKSVHEVDLPIILNLQEGLTALDRHLRPVPAIAESWSYDATGTELKFKLRSDARWSDGKPVTAQDFVAAWKRILTPANHFTTAYFLYPIKGAEDFAEGKLRSFSDVGVVAKSNNELDITFRDPSWNWIESTAIPALFPVREDLIDGPNWLSPGMVTDGPFRYLSHTVGQEFILKRREDYTGAPKSNISELRFEIMSYSDAVKAMKNGKLDVIFRLPPKFRAELQGRPDLMMHPNPPDGTRKLDFNMSRFPTTDANVRRALAYAIDRVELLKQLQIAEPPATTLIPPGLPGGGDPKAGLPFSVRESRMALALAPAGPASTKIDILVPYFDESKEEDRQIAEELKRQWEATLKLQVRIVLATSVSQYLVIRDAGDYNVVVRDFGIESGDPLDPYAAYATGSRFNIQWPDRKYDVLVQDAVRAHATTDVAAAVRKLDDFLLKEAVAVVPLFYRGDLTVIRSMVQGYAAATWQPYYLKNFSIEEQ